MKYYVNLSGNTKKTDELEKEYNLQPSVLEEFLLNRGYILVEDNSITFKSKRKSNYINHLSEGELFFLESNFKKFNDSQKQCVKEILLTEIENYGGSREHIEKQYCCLPELHKGYYFYIMRILYLNDIVKIDPDLIKEMVILERNLS